MRSTHCQRLGRVIIATVLCCVAAIASTQAPAGQEADSSRPVGSALPLPPQADTGANWVVAQGSSTGDAAQSPTTGRPRGRGERGNRGEPQPKSTDGRGPAHIMSPMPVMGAVDAILGIPTDQSATLSVLSRQQSRELNLSWQAVDAPKAPSDALSLQLNAEVAKTVDIGQLKPNTLYRYQLTDKASGHLWVSGQFRTQRPAGTSFSFTVTADSHLDQHTEPALYQRSLEQVVAGQPDFHIDLGDTFMTDKHASFAAATQQYQAQRHYLAQMGRTVPLLLVLGNHDGEDAKLRRGGAQSVAVQANTLRKALFPNPAPGGFFRGNTAPDAQAGELRDYTAFTWGDALFITLTPYWNAASDRNDDGWALSLGRTQYDWLQQTLQGSRARHKFIFIHQLVGGLGKSGRGGVEAAQFGEWGGKNQDGSEGFAARRPGWPEPIHALIKRHGVSAVFHGHDHLYALQHLDGILYQEVPQPGHPGGDEARTRQQAEEYGYRQGEIHGRSGHIRVDVSPQGFDAIFVPVQEAGDAPGNRREERRDGRRQGRQARQDARSAQWQPAQGASKPREVQVASLAPTAGLEALLRPSTDAPSGPDEPMTVQLAQASGDDFDRPRRGGRDDRGDEEREGRRGAGKKGGGKGPQSGLLPPEVAAQNKLSAILGRPTARGVTLNLLADSALQVYVEHGSRAGHYEAKTAVLTLAAGQPQELELSGLPANQPRFYRLRWRAASATKTEGKAGEFAATAEQAFHTQRSPGSRFSFELQGDSHPERAHQFDAQLYARTLQAAARHRPDFYLTMGDDFSVDTLHSLTRETVTGRYLLQRPYLSLIGQTAPLFLVNGNHEQAAAANLDGTPDNVAVWAQNARNSLFPQPAPDGFYSGNATPVPHIGLLRNYFAWTWGDALFVVIDPYWHSKGVVDNAIGSRDKPGADPQASEPPSQVASGDGPAGGAAHKGKRHRPGEVGGGAKGKRDLWNVTLGDTQYAWLKDTLERSQAKYKFVFAHHVLGTGRGGISQAKLYEWGGQSRNGRNEFAAQRPGWALPIHDLFVNTGVSIFFQGHDHVFAREQLDGVIYQTAPEPADASGTLYFKEAYPQADVFPNAGRIRVEVGPDKARVSYVRPPADSSASPARDEEVFSYEVLPKR